MKLPVGDVGLPALVGELGLEADPGGPGPLVGLGHHKPPPPEHAPDRGDRRCVAALLNQVVPDRLRAGVEALLTELLAQPHDLVLELGGGPVGDVLRRPGPRLDRFVASRPVPPHHLGHPALGHPVGPSHLPVAPPLEDHGLDHVPRQLHRRPPSQVSTMLRHRCPLSGELRHSRGHKFGR